MPRILTILFVIALVFSPPARASVDPRPNEMFGVGRAIPELSFFGGGDLGPEAWALGALGVGEARNDAGGTQREDGTFMWAGTDLTASYLSHLGIRLAPVAHGSPYWATSLPGHGHAPPREAAYFANEMREFAKRYGRGGSFWRDGPDERKIPPPAQELPVLRYEIWNEPNLALFWRPAPDPARYAELFALSRDAIKSVDPRATVIFGGLAPAGAVEFLRATYAARPDLRGQVDGFGLHPYGPTAASVLRQVRAFRAALTELGEGDAPIYITELGWPTRGRDIGFSTSPVPDETRAASLSLAADALARSDCGIGSIDAFAWTTPEQDPDDTNHWLGIYGAWSGPTRTSEAWRNVVQRYLAEPRRGAPFPVCGAPSRRASADKRLPLRIMHPDWDGARCVSAWVTYRGNPLKGAVLTATWKGPRRAGRKPVVVRASAKTADDGTAEACAKAGRTIARGSRITAQAEVEPVAASRAATVKR